MQNSITEESPARRTTCPFLPWLPVFVFVLGIVSVCLLVWSVRVNERQRQNFALADAIVDMQFQIVTAHLWFEEIVNGDTAEDIDAVWAGIDHGLHLAKAILKGGPTEHGFVLEPLENENLRADAREIVSLVTRIRAITRQRYENIPSSGIGSELDTQLDSTFRSFTQKTATLEYFVETDHVQNQTKSRQLFLGILVGWSMIVLVTAAGLWNRERRRIAAEQALLAAHGRLREQANELEEHRLHLMERVEERTAELTIANRELQREITEKLALQAESIRVAHLASLGELAAGVAHEINNPISGIINYAEILIDDSGKPAEECEIPNRIIKEGNRIATIVRSLLSFAHQSGRTERSSVRLHEVLADALALCGKQMEKDGIHLRVDVPADLPSITASPYQIEQVFLNIINNARYALNQKYTGSNTGKLLEIRGTVVTESGRSPQVMISFHDRGVGIPPAIAGKIMDPFFSTKPKGVGTGLGLSISHGIISDHGGRIVTGSVENEHTTVQVILPVRTSEEERDAGQGSCHR